MATRVLDSAYVAPTFRPEAYATGPIAPASTAADIARGTLMKLNAGKIEPMALDGGGYVLDNPAQLAFCLTGESFKTALAAAGSVPFQQTQIGCTRLVPGAYIICNLYADGLGGASETIAVADLGAAVKLRMVGTGISAKLCADKLNAPADTLDANIVELIDPVGTVNGRVLINIESADKFPF